MALIVIIILVLLSFTYRVGYWSQTDGSGGEFCK